MHKVLQALGIAFLVQIALIITTVGYFRWVYEPEPREVGAITNLYGILNSSYLNPEQQYTVITSRQTERAWNGDFSRWACLEISDYSGIESSQRWVPGPETEEIFKKVRRRAADFGDAKNCFGKDYSGNEENIIAHIQRVETIGRASIEGATVALFDVQSERLLYVEWQH